jgi:HEAT repeat protein
VAALVTTHQEVVVRETAVAALGSLGHEAGLPAVLAATTDVATVRRRAVLALAAFEGPEVEAALERLSDDRDRQTRQAAEDLLQGWGPRDET